MVSSSVYPGLERKPGGPDNWVEAAGGLPSYIERIAKHLHYERGYSISRAIATAVNTVKRWAAGGTVTKSGTTKRITPATQAKAAAAVAEWEAKKNINLAAPDIGSTQTMVCLQLEPATASKVAVSGGVPAEELHITIGYFGEVDDDGITEIERMVTECVQEYGEPLAGQIGGVLAFPPGDQGTPWAATVDIPRLSRLQIKVVDHFRGSDYAISEEHGYTPHVSRTYDDPQEPLEAIPVKFGSVALVRGNELIAEIPLGEDDGADQPEDGTLSPDGAPQREAKVNLSAYIERARNIADPEVRGRVRAKILELSLGQPAPTRELTPEQITAVAERITDGLLDLAMTKDGRKSFKRQGKWGHGFVPLDEKAVQAKAKGSPIATKRINRIFGGVRRKVDSAPKAVPSPKTKPTVPVKVKATDGGSVSANSAALLGGRAQAKDATASQRVDPRAKREVGRGRGSTARAIKAWDSIPEDQKTTRNGKRYVVSTYNGKQQLTEWVGENAHDQVKADPSKVRYRTMSRATAAKFSSGELRNLLAVPGQPKQVRSVLNQALKKASVAGKKVAA